MMEEKPMESENEVKPGMLVSHPLRFEIRHNKIERLRNSLPIGNVTQRQFKKRLKDLCSLS